MINLTTCINRKYMHNAVTILEPIGQDSTSKKATDSKLVANQTSAHFVNANIFKQFTTVLP
jgi:hypothetical protein